MEQFLIPAIQGVNKDFPSRIIPEGRAQDCKNVLFEKGRIKNRWGYTSLGGNLPLNGEVMRFIYYEKLNPNNKYTLCFTTRDAYKLNQNTGNWEFITEKYITGTASCAGSTTAVVGNTTSWNTGWSPASLWQIKFGTQDPNGTGTPDTWYNIVSFGTATALTLTTNGPNTGGLVNYVIRKCWTGDIDNEISVTTPFDPTLSEKVVVVTNGVDELKKYSATANFVAMSGLTNIKCKFVNYFGSIAYEHLTLGNIVDNSVNYPQRLKVSDAGYIETYSGLAEYELLNSQDSITGMAELGGRIFVYKENSITEMWADPSGSNEDPFNFNQNKVSDLGLSTVNLLVNMGKFHIFLNSQNVWIFDGINTQPVGGEIILTMLAEINKEKLSHGFAHAIKEQGIIIFFVPTTEGNIEYPYKGYVYNYVDNTWSIWIPTNQITAMGIYKKSYAPTWAELKTAGTLWSAMNMRWSDLKRYDENFRYLLGDKDGYVYAFEKPYVNDNGSSYPITHQIITRDYPIQDPKHTILILELIVGLYKVVDNAGLSITTTIQVECSVDFGNNWSTAQTQSETWAGLTTDYVEKTFNFMEKGKQVRFRITSTTPMEIEALNIGFNNVMGVVK